uniref:Uncharacterized protein n=1 Tax=Haptolina brevifila TaxID=156173 RepID=A0A7S2FNB6_9EUKA
MSFFPVDLVAQCFTAGESTSICDTAQRCACLSRPECGWCSATATCTRLLPAPSRTPLLTPQFSDEPVCSCAAGLLTHANVDFNQTNQISDSDPSDAGSSNILDGWACGPRMPPPLPPSPPPSLPPSPSPPPPAVSWLSGIRLASDAPPVPLLVQWFTWALCTVTICANLICCMRADASRKGPVPRAATLSFRRLISPATSPRFSGHPPNVQPHTTSGVGMGGRASDISQADTRHNPKPLQQHPRPREELFAALPARLRPAVRDALRSEPALLWMDQPIVPLARLGLLLSWLLANIAYAVLLGLVGIVAPSAGFVLLLLPIAAMVGVLLSLRQSRGTVYVLSQRGACTLSLAPAFPRLCRSEAGW